MSGYSAFKYLDKRNIHSGRWIRNTAALFYLLPHLFRMQQYGVIEAIYIKLRDEIKSN